jgi:thiol-disulfide isomerase/thioredoxin
MSRSTFTACLALGVVFLISTSQAQTTAPVAEDPEAKAALLAYRAMQPPQVDASRRDDQAYVASYIHDAEAFEAKRAAIAKAFCEKFPNDPAVSEMMQDRWMSLLRLGEVSTVMAEMDQAMANHPDADAKAGILFMRAVVMLNTDPDKLPAAIDEFIKAAPNDERGAELLLSERENDPDKRIAIFRRIVQLYPTSEYAKTAEGQIRQIEGIGKPFELTFTDAISGKEISVQKELKGKIVVIDFWATWCGPCVGQMPENKELYSEYKDKGVEFIGVSLDQPEADGGLKALKDFVAQNGITWPQYYQGKAWDSDFSSGWGVREIPCVFVVDEEGKLYTVDGEGKLADLIPTMLARRDGKQ